MNSSCCPPDNARTSLSDSAVLTTPSWIGCWLRSVLRELIPSTVEALSGERRTEMYRVDITADLNDEDETGYVWTFLDEARDPGQIKPGAIIVAGDQDAAAVCEVIDLAPAGDGIIVHLRLLPGLVEDYRALVERARVCTTRRSLGPLSGYGPLGGRLHTGGTARPSKTRSQRGNAGRRP